MTDRRRPPAALLAPALAALLAACGPPAERGPDGVEIDTVGGIVTIVSVDGAPGPAGTLSGSPLRIGRLEGDGPDVFGRIAAVALGPDRHVYVADGVALEVRVFDPAGGFVRAFGGQGGGPGEFEAIDGLRVTDDGSVVVRDPQLGRVSRFGPEGTFERSFRLERSFFIFSDGTEFWVDSGGRVYDQIQLDLGPDAPDRYALVVYTDGVATDTVVVAEHRPRRAFARQGDRVVLGMIAPFGARPMTAVSAGGEIAAAIGDAYRVALTNTSGDTLRVFGRRVPPAPVERAEAAAAIDAMRTRAGELAPGAVLDEVEAPDVKPYLTELRAAGGGGWWLGRYRGELDPEDPSAANPTEWDVFDPSGALVGTVTTPPLLVFEIGPDYVAGVETDELGVQYAAVYDLARSP